MHDWQSIFVMDQGKLAEVGTHEELMEKHGIYSEFFQSQAEWYDVKKEDAPDETE